MIENQRTPSLDKQQEIEWTHYNYPPILCIMHFTRSEIPQNRKLIIFSLFALHLASLAVCFLNIICNCIEGGLGILYSILFSFIFTPLLLFVFYRGLTGLCKPSSSLKMFLILQPVAIALEIVGSIGNFLGFNGFTRVSELFKEGRGEGVLSLIVSLVFLGMGAYSSFIYIKVVRQRGVLKAS